MNVRVITASAGSGKTYRLSEVLQESLDQQAATPAGIVATTFTKQAAAELTERARGRLLSAGQVQAAHELLAARIGTVNSVCGSIVTDFAFELGMSPQLRVLDEVSAKLELHRALAGVLRQDTVDRVQGYASQFQNDFDWRIEVQRIIEAGRANGLTSGDLRTCADRSRRELDVCMGALGTTKVIDAAMADAIEVALASIDTDFDTTKTTKGYVSLLHECKRDLGRGRMSWGQWAKLTTKNPAKKSAEHAISVQQAAVWHLAHPRLREQMHGLIDLLFEVAAEGLEAYQAYKRQNGVIDFVDQETLALQLLRRDDVRADLEGQIELALIDEFQDTSPIQLAIFLELARLAEGSVWVGDPKQAIFGFRGTDPKLMDAAIETLTAPSHDADLIEDATKALRQNRPGTVPPNRLETLPVSYRSRPELVHATSAIFAKAFASQGMPEEHTRLTPYLVDEPPGLGPVFEYWPLEAKNNRERARAVAEGVNRLFERKPLVRGRQSGGSRPATYADVALLCRTNVQCQDVAEALAELGIPAVVPKMRLLRTAECHLALAGLRLWIDPRDGLARSEIARLLSYPEDLDGLVAALFEVKESDTPIDEPAVTRLLEAREAQSDLGPLAALQAVIGVLDISRMCAAWGSSTQRKGNLDALAGHVQRYIAESEARRDPVTVVGALRYLEELADDFGWQNHREDSQALLRGEEAVTISTWHRAKGLEWPIVVLYGLESIRKPVAHGVHVMSDRENFDVEQPLAERWVRFWPNPYNTLNQNGPVREAFQAGPIYADLVGKAEREALRVLYVGWTRARDRLIFAPQQGKLFKGILKQLQDIDPSLMTLPKVSNPTVWAGYTVEIETHSAVPAEPTPRPVEPGLNWVTAGPRAYPPAVVTASSVQSTGVADQVTTIGPRPKLADGADMAKLGQAVHGFLAADRVERARSKREAMAQGLLERWNAHRHLEALELLAASDRLQAWVDRFWPGALCRTEWSVTHRLKTGSLLRGVADLVLEFDDGFVVVDHKSFPGEREQAIQKAVGFAGQLEAYAGAISVATGKKCAGKYIHLPLSGCIVRVGSGQ